MSVFQDTLIGSEFWFIVVAFKSPIFLLISDPSNYRNIPISLTKF